jgi:hypothetical protein
MFATHSEVNDVMQDIIDNHDKKWHHSRKILR